MYERYSTSALIRIGYKKNEYPFLHLLVSISCKSRITFARVASRFVTACGVLATAVQIHNALVDVIAAGSISHEPVKTLAYDGSLPLLAYGVGWTGEEFAWVASWKKEGSDVMEDCLGYG